MKSRLFSAIEFICGAAVVVGHNVFRVVPNEVPILAIAGLVSLRLRDRAWSGFGFRRPASWPRVVAIAIAAAALRILLGDLVIDPLTRRVWPPAVAPAGASDIPGHALYALIALGIVWSFAAFGEEIGYRGYLLNRAADVGGRSTGAYWTAVLLSSALFGIGHWYKGPAGVIDSGVAGLILGAAYMLSGRTLWTSILAHGFIDTFAVIVVYFGWAS
jgi:membrane protease YdiL (CAAX protease family)